MIDCKKSENQVVEESAPAVGAEYENFDPRTLVDGVDLVTGIAKFIHDWVLGE